jgi:hypothetical protein
MWYPNKQQWVVLVLGVSIFFSALSLRAMEPMFLTALSTLSFVWVLELFRGN